MIWRIQHDDSSSFLDMDGTILNEDNRVTNHTNDVIQEVRQKALKYLLRQEEHMMKFHI